MHKSFRPASAVALGAASMLLTAGLQGPARAASLWRPPNMEKTIFDTGKIKLGMERSNLVRRLVAIARDFDDEDKVDYELRAHALAIAGRVDRDSEPVATCLAQLNKDGRTIGEGEKRGRISQQLARQIANLMEDEDNEANLACAAYVADVALRFDPEGKSAGQIGEHRAKLTAKGHEADWTGMLLPPIPRPGRPGEMPNPVTVELPMPGGTAREFARQQSRIKGLVVQELPNGAHAGAVSAINATALEREGVKGLIFTFNQAVGPKMGGCLEEVVKFLRVRYAKQRDRIPEGYEIAIGFHDKYQLKDGPSAATVFALLLDSLFSGEEIDEEFAATGDITADGMVVKVGGVAAKIRGATKRGCRIVGIPAGNASGIEDVLVMDGPEQLLDIQIFTMKDFDEAHAISRKDKSPNIRETLAAFQEVATFVKKEVEDNGKKVIDLLKTPTVQKRLDSVVGKMPNHLSAELLLDYGRGKAPTRLSVGGSFQEINILTSGLRRVRQLRLDGAVQEDARETVEGLGKIADLIDPRLKDYQEAMVDLAEIFAEGRKDGESDEKLAGRIGKAMESVDRVRLKLQEDPEIVEEIMD